MFQIITEPSSVEYRTTNVETAFKCDIVKQVKSHFASSASSYGFNPQLQLEVGANLLSMIDENSKELIRKSNAKAGRLIALDLGCGPGLFTEHLAERYENLISMDLSQEMLVANESSPNRIQSNAHSLPFQNNTLDSVFSSLMIQWCDFKQVITEVNRVLKPGKTAYISTLIKGSLCELETAWAEVDNDTHIHKYLSQQAIVHEINRIEWQEVSVTVKTHQYWFEGPRSLAKELKSLGANFVQDRKNKGLTPKSKWLAMESAYRRIFADPQRDLVPATYQVVYIKVTK